MSDIAPVNFAPTSFDPVLSGTERCAPARHQTPSVRPSDRVELSDRARYLDQLSRMPAVRTDLVDSVRAQIAAGTYQTMDRLEGAIQSLADELGL